MKPSELTAVEHGDPRGTSAGSRAARWCAEYRFGLWRPGGRDAVHPSFGRHGVLHRVNRCRQTHRRGGQRHAEEGQPRTGRQEPAGHLPPTPISIRRPMRLPSASISTPANAAIPAAGSSCTRTWQARWSKRSWPFRARCRSAIRWTRARRWGRSSRPSIMGKIDGYVKAAAEAGAGVALGGAAISVEGLSGQFYGPTVVTGVSPEMAIATEEVFGPVLSVLTFRDADEAIALANSASYGLSAGVWSRDGSTCLDFARRVRAGTVWTNTWMDGFGGTALRRHEAIRAGAGVGALRFGGISRGQDRADAHRRHADGLGRGVSLAAAPRFEQDVQALGWLAVDPAQKHLGHWRGPWRAGPRRPFSDARPDYCRRSARRAWRRYRPRSRG